MSDYDCDYDCDEGDVWYEYEVSELQENQDFERVDEYYGPHPVNYDDVL
tara:strand:+ start:1445 stop:1591 length:147 start_codon:yes stop_codon:yes gene_type:complete